MANLMLTVGGVWGTIIGWFQSFIPSFGLTIIVFTIALKLILSPLEIYQKISSKKTAEKQAILQPKIEKLQKQYGNNKELLNQKTMELYKKENFNLMGSCLGMLINLVITILVFFTLFSSLNQISQYNIKTEYADLTENYKIVLTTKLKQDAENNASITITTDEDLNALIEEINNDANLTESQKASKINTLKLKTIINDIDSSSLTDDEKLALKNTSKEFATKESANYYGKIKEGFLWIKNIYRPDTYASTFPNSDEYLKISGVNFDSVSAENPYEDIYGVSYTVKDDAMNAFKNNFNEVAGEINTKYSGWNGWLILVVLSGLITVLSIFITNLSNKPKPQYDKKGNEIQAKKPNNYLMMILLPILMIVFTLQYSAAFALYIVMNSLMSVIIGFVTTLVMNKIEKSKEQKKEA